MDSVDRKTINPASAKNLRNAVTSSCRIPGWALAALAARSLSMIDLTMAEQPANWSAIWAVPMILPIRTSIILNRRPHWTLSNATVLTRTANRLNTTHASAWSADHMADMFNMPRQQSI